MMQNKKVQRIITQAVIWLFLQSQLGWAYPYQAQALRPMATAKRQSASDPSSDSPFDIPPLGERLPVVQRLLGQCRLRERLDTRLGPEKRSIIEKKLAAQYFRVIVTESELKGLLSAYQESNRPVSEYDFFLFLQEQILDYFLKRAAEILREVKGDIGLTGEQAKVKRRQVHELLMTGLRVYKFPLLKNRQDLVRKRKKLLAEFIVLHIHLPELGVRLGSALRGEEARWLMTERVLLSRDRAIFQPALETVIEELALIEEVPKMSESHRERLYEAFYHLLEDTRNFDRFAAAMVEVLIKADDGQVQLLELENQKAFFEQARKIILRLAGEYPGLKKDFIDYLITVAGRRKEKTTLIKSLLRGLGYKNPNLLEAVERRKGRGPSGEEGGYLAPAEVLEDEKAVGKMAAGRIIELVKEAPDAVIVISADSTAGLVCDALAERYREAKDGQGIDFSKAKFFLLSAYTGLSEDHPLSQTYFMRKAFYERLRAIDPARAPKIENIHIPYLKNGEEPEQAAARYEQLLQQAIRETGRGRIDLVVSGIGSAYPEYDKEHRFLGVKGGSLSLNQPGSFAEDRTRAVKLSSHTRLDIKYHAKNLKFQPGFKKDYSYRVPTDGLTIGIADILESNEILLLALGEKSAPVIKQMYESEPSPDFPATFLREHKNVRWILDREAGYYLPQVRRPWTVQEMRFEWTKEAITQAVLEVLADNRNLTLGELAVGHLEDIGVPGNEIERFDFGNLKGIEAIRTYSRQFLRGCLHSEGKDLLPKGGDEVIIFSPRPDDDVINMAAVIRMLAARGCKLTIVYLTSGENAVRDNYRVTRRIYRELVKEFLDKKSLPPRPNEGLNLKEQARAETRRREAQNGLLKLLGPEEKQKVAQEFLNLAYYKHIGFVGIKPIDRKDIEAVRRLLDRINPDYIFFSAEKDPHATHGLGTEIITRALRQRLLGGKTGVSRTKTPIMCGFRGAWQEWPLYQPENLVIVAFNREEMSLKEAAIKEHFSQLYPLFPGPDPRKFWQRARFRNRQTGRLLEQTGILKELGYPANQVWYAEALRLFPYQEFLSGFEENELVAVTEDGSDYRLAKRADGTFTETLRINPYEKVIDLERTKRAVFMQLLTHSNPEIREYLLRYSKQKLAQYLVELANSSERSRVYQRAADYWAMAVDRYLKEGQVYKAVECKNNAVKNMRLVVEGYPQPLSSVKLAESLKKDAEINEGLGFSGNKSIAARCWAQASMVYNDLALKAKSRDEKYYFYQESAKGAENAAGLDKELEEVEFKTDKKMEIKRHQAKNWHFAALNWLSAKRHIEALRCAREAIRLDYELGNEIFKAMDLAIAANSCFSLGRFVEAIRYGRLAVRLNKRLSKSSKLSEGKRLERKLHLVRDLKMVSDSYFNIEQYDKAIEYGREALDTLKTEKLNRAEVGLEHILPVYKTLAHSHYFRGYYNQAAEYAQKGAGLFLKEWNDEKNAGNLLSLAGKNRSLLAGKSRSLSERLKEHAKSVECYEGAAILKENAGEDENASKDWAFAAMGRVKLAKSGIDRLGNYERAGYDDKRSAELAKAGGRREKAIRHFLFATKNFDKALMSEGKEDCKKEAVEILKGLVSEIKKKELRMVGFQDLLEQLEIKHPDIFSLETEKYLQDALRKTEDQLQQQESRGTTGPLATTDIVQAILSAA